jgi:hypothetical protein
MRDHRKRRPEADVGGSGSADPAAFTAALFEFLAKHPGL